MNRNKKYILAIALLAILAGGVLILTKHHQVPTPGRYMDVESYVKYDISHLSPIKESLGGTFYVTSIETHGGTGTVSYEDGHNAYTADFQYTIDENGKPTVTNFAVRE